MSRGGAREGAGRKVGSETRRTSEIALKAVAEGISPLEVMVATMREFWERALKTRGSAREQLLMLASEEASRAAPYIHARLSHMDAKIVTKSADPLDLSDADLIRIAAAAARGSANRPEQTDSPEEPDRVH